MRRNLTFPWLCLFALSSLAIGLRAAEVTTGTLLDEMSDLARLASSPDPAYRTIQFSSYDRRSTTSDAPGWFSNADGFGGEPIPGFLKVLREPRDGQAGLFLLAEASGPGAMVRGWSAGMGGILREAREGLPSVFGRGLQVLEASRAVAGLPVAPKPPRDGGKTRATADDVATKHLLMAVLMQSVEDTTAVRRCGPAGLARLRADGLWLQRQIESGADYVPWLAALNGEYRRLNLTMGGVADCMALCFALHEWFGL